jgi:hypothetical protein
MADVDIEIKGQPETISALTFKATVVDAIDLLREYDSAISGVLSGSLSWYLSQLSTTPNILIGFRSRVKPVRRFASRVDDFGPTVTHSLVSGLDTLERQGKTPPYLSVGGMERVQHLASLIGKNGATGFRVRADKNVVDVTQATIDNVRKLLPVKRTSIGSVEGKLEGINLHGKSRVIIYRAINNKAVTCDFAPDRFMERVKELLGRRVVAFGTLHKNVNGDTLRVTMERIESAENVGLLPREQWPDPDFAQALSTAEYIRRIRGGG